MLRELRAKTSNYEIYYLGSIQLAVQLLLLTDKDNGQDQIAEQINTTYFDIVYNIKDLVKVDDKGLYQVARTIMDITELDHDDLMDWLDQRLADLSDNERELLELLSSPQQQPRAYYYGLRRFCRLVIDSHQIC